MRKLVFFLMMIVLTVSLSAQGRNADVFVYVSPAIGGTAEEQDFFNFNLQEEVKGSGYGLANTLNSNPDVAWSQSDFYIDVELSYDASYREHVITLMLYKTETGDLIVTSGMAYQTLEEMYDWNLTMIYRVMANAPIEQTIVYQPAAAVSSGLGFGLGSGIEPDHWLHLGVRMGYSRHFYTNTGLGKNKYLESLVFGNTVEGAIEASIQLKPFIGIQTGLIFTGEDIPLHTDEVNSGQITHPQYNYKAFSLIFPILAKGTFHWDRILLNPLLGFYVPITLSRDLIVTVPLGLTAGLNVGVRLGPGNLFFDLRYSFDFGETRRVDEEFSYVRSMLSLSVGYSFKLNEKKSNTANTQTRR
jgi:hypothetical protein